MLGPKHHFNMKDLSFKILSALLIAQMILTPQFLHAAESGVPGLHPVDESKLKKISSSLYADMFDRVFYEEGAQFLRLDNTYKKLTFSKRPARNVNIYDEVPDSLFFTNRHAKERLSKQELQEGPSGVAPASGKLVVTKGKVEGVNPGFFVKDSQGQQFLLKFDPIDNPELASAAEAISSKIFHAIGYNVPAYHIVQFQLDEIEADGNATFYDSTGFKKHLTKEKVEETLLFVASQEDGSYRASASTLLAGKIKGPFDLDGYRKNDPNDPLPHRFLREIRALRVFCSWVDYYDMRSGNTLDVVEEQNGQPVVKHYVIDYGSTLGSAGYDPKPPQYGYEYIFDFGDFFKSVATFGFWKKAWQKRWEENGKKIAYSSLGYYNNVRFQPGKWKNQMPYHAFKDLTAADGYWAAKIIMSFTDEDIRSIVETGKLTDKKAEEVLGNILIERRDMIGRYWFTKSCPLDRFEVSGSTVKFTDLMAHYQLESAKARYHYEVRKTKLSGDFEGESLDLDLSKLPDTFVLSLRAQYSNGAWGKRVCLSLEKESGGLRLAGIKRQL